MITTKDVIDFILEDDIYNINSHNYFLKYNKFDIISNILHIYENKNEELIKYFKEKTIIISDYDRFTIFLIKKSLLDLNFYDFILELNIEKLNNILLNQIIWFFKSGIHFNLENEIINLIFYNETMSNKIYNELLKIEPDEKMKINYDKIMFKLKLENKLEQKEKVKRIKI